MATHAAHSPQREPDQAEIDQIRAEHEESSERRRGRGAAADVQLAYDDAAEQGVTGTSGQLPHLDAIQRSFGAFDVRGIRAHQGGAAADACDTMGAEAYATGDRVAFAGQPDLHTAAHEAAHVVQQRSGVHLYGGDRDDVHERHADRVADAVVAGEPADYLLAQMASPTARAGAAPGVQMKKKLPEGEEAFQQMWEAHPHNYQADDAENTSSEEVREEHGLPDYLANTCAIRLSIMLNETGETITPAKTAAAGISRRPHYSKKTKQYYIVAASEMWTYLSKYYRSADVVFPPSGRYKDEETFNESFESTIKPLLAGKKGIVAFDKIFGYGGTGHVDLFDGETLSDAAGWYPCQRLMLWYVAVS